MAGDRELQDRVSKKFARLRALPGFPRGATLEGPESVHLDRTIGQRAQSFADLDARATRVFESYEQFSALCERTGERPDDRFPPEVTDLEGFARHLEDQTELIRLRVQERGDRERAVAGLCEAVAMADPDGRVRLIEEARRAAWEGLLVFLLAERSYTDVVRPYEPLRGDPELRGLILALAWAMEPARGPELLSRVVADPGVETTRAALLPLLGYLSFDQMLDGLARTAGAPALAELFLAVALSDDPACWDYLESLLDHHRVPEICELVYRGVIELGRYSGAGTVVAELRASDSSEGQGARDNARREVLDLIRHSPGMSGYYHHLRVAAHGQFLEPLRRAVEQGDAEDVWSRWAGFGGLEEMIEYCVDAVCGDQGVSRHEMRKTHRVQTRRYLETFGTALEEWRRRTRGVTDRHAETLRQALRGLRAGATPDPTVASLRDYVKGLAEGEPGGLPPDDFGQRAVLDGGRALYVSEDCGVVGPLMLTSWPTRVHRRPVLLTTVLADRLAAALGRGPGSLGEAVVYYLDRGQFRAATAAAGDDPELVRQVEERYQARRVEALAPHGDLLREAAASDDPEVRDCLEEVESAVEARDLSEAVAWTDELRGFVLRHRRRSDPRRKSLVEFLNEAGIEVHGDVEVEQLEARRGGLRLEQVRRREHLAVLSEARAAELPEQFQVRCASLAEAMDRPSLWPLADVSERLAAALRTVLKTFEGKWKYREQDSAVAFTMSERLAPWLEAQLVAWSNQIDDLGHPGPRDLIELARAMEERCPDAVVLNRLALGDAPVRAPDPVARTARSAGPALPAEATIPDPVASVQHAAAPTEAPPRTSRIGGEDVLLGLAETLENLTAKVPGCPGATAQQLRVAARAHDWGRARDLAAALIRDDGGAMSRDATLSLPALVLAVAATYEPPALDPLERNELLRTACLASVLFHESVYGQYLYREVMEPFPARALAAVVTGKTLADCSSPEAIALFLGDLAERPSNDPVFQEVMELLWRSNLLSCSAHVGQLVWDTLKGRTRKMTTARSNLLFLLFRCRQNEALRALAQTAGPLSEQIVHCLSLFLRAESEAGVRPYVHQAVAVFRESSRSRKNTEPWLALFEQLSSERLHEEGRPCSVALESETPTSAGDEGLRLELRLGIESFIDPPVQLRIEFGADAAVTVPLLHEDDELTPSRLIPVHIPPWLIEATDGPVTLPYRVVGRTLKGRPVDERGHWELSNPREAVVPFTAHEINLAWSGAGGSPVRAKQFHGRSDDVQFLEGLLNAGDRPQSVMLFGERRIGKTSLMLRLVETNKPRLGRFTGIYCDIAGLHIPEEPGVMGRMLFEAIVAAIQWNENNLAVREALSNASGKGLPKVDRMVREAEKLSSLSDKLNVLADKLSEHSGEVIGRVVVFIDEFDRFVEPMLRDRGDEVEKMLWDLRNVVLLSNRVGLVLAGSGLQRMFVDGLDKALYMSIAQRELLPFNWDRERSASMATFLPEWVAQRVCDPGSYEELCRHAHQLCGGYPHYLALLGYSAAVLLNGHRWTRTGLDQVVARMVQGDLKAPDRALGPAPFQVSPDQFYAPTFVTLQQLPPLEQALAKVILAHIASETTANIPWLPRWRAVAAPDAITLANEEQRHAVLTLLTKERVVEEDRPRGQVRVRVPLTASAIREHAALIRHEAARTFKTLLRRSEP